MLKKILLSLLVLLLSVWGVWHFFFSKKPAPEDPPKVVEVEVLKPLPLSKKLVLVGIVSPRRVTTFTAQDKGVMRAHLVEEGGTVTGGTLLAELRNGKLRRQVLYTGKKAELAKAHYERQKKLLLSKTKSQRSIDEAHEAWLTRKIEHEKARKELGKTLFIAPYDGVCGIFKVREGEAVKENDEIVTFYDVSSYILEIRVPETMVKKITSGLAFRVNDFEGKISSVQPLLDAKTRMGVAKAILPGTLNLTPGAHVRVHLEVDRRENVLSVPNSALALEGNRTFVYRITDGKAEKVFIETGLEGNERIEITEGLSPGDPVVLKGQEGLWPTKPVKILETPESP